MNARAPTGHAAPPAPSAELTVAEQVRMVDGLRRQLQAAQSALQPGGLAPVELIETHISFVLLADGFAYKFKRAVNPGFLDFTTLALRWHYCHEELRLNRRLAPDLYLDVVGVHGSAEAPTLGGPGPLIDCAVRMRAFPQQGLWDRLIARDALQATQVDELAGLLVGFHRDAAVADARARFGHPAQVRTPLRDSLAALDQLLHGATEHAQVRTLQAWEARTGDALEPVFTNRRHEGRVRECHGDLHLGNVTQIDGHAVVFDCIEFNDDFRWIDVMSDLAFLAMDLRCHGRADLAHRLVDGYLERSGDYGGAHVLRYYIVHRALVRAKVAALRDAQDATATVHRAAHEAVAHYLDQAVAGSQPPHPALLITHGFSGSGKTSLTQGLLEAIGAVRVRADVQRKRLFDLAPLERGAAPLYTQQATEATYTHLLDTARELLQAGFSVVLDATFLQRRHRDAAHDLARALRLPFAILHFDADVPTLRERLARREARGDDASDAGLAVLEEQLRTAQPLAPDELHHVHHCVPVPDCTPPQVDWSPLLQRLAAGGLAP
jgi:aminoglycoside phosphotransferase family enzyme/predicted kinase